MIWIASCILKYSDAEFYSKSDTNNGVYLVKPEYVGDPIFIQNNVLEFLTQLRSNAIDGSLEAHGRHKVSKKYYHGAVQCIDN